LMRTLLACVSLLIAFGLLAHIGYCLQAWIRDYGLRTLPFGAYSQTIIWGGGGLIFLVVGIVALYRDSPPRRGG
jgi:hypothetical protein